MKGRFAEFVQRKTAAAARARFLPFHTIEDRSGGLTLETVGNDFTRRLFDGPFFESPAVPGHSLPAVSLVFVQSRDGNTEADDPSTLGGGDTDKHVIYEGLSRVRADAVLSGAKTVGEGDLVFSTWHQRLVDLRAALGKPRHPIQVVMTTSGALPIETGLLFNVPDVRVVILTADRAANELAGRIRERPWISMISSGEHADVRTWMSRLLDERGVDRISAVGGRITATALIDAGLVSDLYLTTAAQRGGRPGTPLYAGNTPPRRELVVRKQSDDGVVFEHLLLARTNETTSNHKAH